MNRNDFLNMIGSRAPLNRSVLGEVYELVDLFPYCQSAHMLLLKGLSDNDDIKFEKQLRNSALHIADREVLYYLLKSDKLPEPEVENKVAETESSDTEIADQSPFMQQTVIETAKNSDLLISEFEKGIEKEEENEDLVTSMTGESYSVLMTETNPDEESESVILLMDDNAEGEEERVVFMDPGFSMPVTDELLELDSEAIETVREEYENNENISEDSKIDSRKQFQNDLIDKFIIANPRIEPIRDKSDLPGEDLSVSHTFEKGSFVTETLARIYVSQGYYSKAIEIYEKLSLKFPEKSSYFATQIEKVKEYIK